MDFELHDPCELACKDDPVEGKNGDENGPWNQLQQGALVLFALIIYITISLTSPR